MVPPLLLLFLNWALGHSPIPAPREQSQLLEEGRKQHEKLQQLSLLPSYGQCWSQALAKLHRGCRELDQEQQSRMALDFTHCHLDRSGKSFPPCTESSSLRECTQDMDPVAFGAYTEFFTHTYSICYYLQSELWQQQAEYTINRLTVTSDSVARQLEVTNQMAQEMLNAQNATLRGQEEILRNGDTLKLTLQQSTQGVQRVFREMQDSTQEQQRVFSEIFHRLSYLHQFVMIESTTFYSFTYNLMAFLVAFLVTSTQRTAAARLVLYILICLSVLLERTIYSSVLGPSESSFEYAERVYSRVWLLRKLVALTGLLVLAYSFVTYQDVGRQSLELLRGVRETQCQLQRAIEEAAPLLSPAPTRWREGRTKICQIDLGIGDVKLPKEEPQPSAELAVLPSRTPRKTKPPPRSPSRSATRRHSARRSEVSVYNILVSESPSKYNLRQRKSSGSVAGT